MKHKFISLHITVPSPATANSERQRLWMIYGFPANISCFPRRLEDVFSVTLFVFQDALAIRLPKTSSRRLQDMFARRLAIMSSRRVCKTPCNYVFKTSWKTKKCYTEDVLKTSWRRLQYVFTKTNVCWVSFDDILCITSDPVATKRVLEICPEGLDIVLRNFQEWQKRR